MPLSISVTVEQLQKSIFYFGQCMCTTAVFSLSYGVIVMHPFTNSCSVPGLKRENSFQSSLDVYICII